MLVPVRDSSPTTLRRIEMTKKKLLESDFQYLTGIALSFAVVSLALVYHNYAYTSEIPIDDKILNNSGGYEFLTTFTGSEVGLR